MKTFFLTTLALMTMGMAMAHNSIEPESTVNTVIIKTSGDVILRQGTGFNVDFDKGEKPFSSDWKMEDSVLFLNGSSDFVVTVERLDYLDSYGSGDVIADQTFEGQSLAVRNYGSGDVRLNLDYDYVYAALFGSGDITLRGRCHELVADKNGSGDFNLKKLEVERKDVATGKVRVVPSLAGLSELLAELGTNLERLSDSVDWKGFEEDMERWGQSMEEWGRHMEEWGRNYERQMEGRDPRDKGNRKDAPKPAPDRWGQGTPDVRPQPDVKPDFEPKRRPGDRVEKKSLLLDPHWTGVDAGLNILMGPGSSANFEGEYAYLEQRALRSWCFNFNIADVGIAFTRNHFAGLYTGIGLGWNNFSFNTPVRIYKGADHLEGQLIDESVEGKVKKSKLGVLYVQAPLMIEIRPTRKFFIAAGVTGGLRVNSWTKVKFENKDKEKAHSDFYLNPVKLDATLRAGGKDIGFFASFDLLPQFVDGKAPTSHTLNVGFTLIF